MSPDKATTFPALVRAAAAEYGDDIAIILKSRSMPDENITFSELDVKSAALAKGLIARGAGKGTRIGFICANGPSFAVTLAAIARIGAIAIPLSTLIKANELVRTLRQSDVALLLVQREILGNDYVERLCDALPDLLTTPSPELRLAKAPFLRCIVSTGNALPPALRNRHFLTEAAGTVSDELLREIESEVHPTDQALEIYTSGSMALPKGVKHDHGPLLFRTHYVRSMIGVTRGQEIAAYLPMFWIGGMIMTLLPNWVIGATTICTDDTLGNSRIAMGSVLAADDLKLMAQTKPFWALGMTETIGPYAYGDELRAPGYPLCAPLDHIAESFEVRVYTEGRLAGEGEVGEIQVRGYALTPGLHKVERADHFEPDGFYKTGDMGLVGGNRINFVGRNGDIIKTAGANVSPAEVELELQQLEGVHSAYVVGLPDQERGQLLVAALVPREGATLDVDAVQAQLRRNLSAYKVPRAYVLLSRAEVPLLHSNKVARRLLERLLAERLGRHA